MFELKTCRICLNNNVRLHQISGSEVQDVYEKLTNKVQEDGYQYFACYICYHQLKICQQLAIKLQKSKELLQQILPLSEFHLRPISFLDRLTHGLVHSLAVTNIQCLQIPEYNQFIKIEKQDESDTNGEIVGGSSDFEFDKGSSSPKKIKLGENHNIKHGGFNSIESGKNENIFKFETNTVLYSANLSRIVNVEKNKQALVKKTFICNECGKPCETKAVLIKHISGHKPVTIEPNERNIDWKSLCEKKYTSEIKENDSLNENLPYKCKYCNYTCTFINNFKRPIITHTGEKPFKCPFCNYTCTRNCDFNRHIRTHTGEKPFKCQYCNYTCARNSDLKLHIRTHTGEKPFKCQFCNYTCARNCDLKRHIRTHTGKKQFKCQYCNYTSTFHSDLKVHIRTHTGEKPFKCNFCNYTSACNSILKIHIRTHTGEKPFKCQYCSHTFTDNSNLTRHITTHTGEKPYQCQYCNYTCKQNSLLIIHTRTHTGDKPFKCQYCSYKCTVNSNLKRHIKTHTREKPF